MKPDSVDYLFGLILAVPILIGLRIGMEWALDQALARPYAEDPMCLFPKLHLHCRPLVDDKDPLKILD